MGYGVSFVRDGALNRGTVEDVRPSTVSIRGLHAPRLLHGAITHHGPKPWQWRRCHLRLFIYVYLRIANGLSYFKGCDGLTAIPRDAIRERR